jgi:hypothetical protein
MALAAGWKGLSPDERHLMGQAMLCVKHPINSAFGNDGRALEKLRHKGVRLKQIAVHKSGLTVIDAIPGSQVVSHSRWNQVWRSWREPLQSCKQVHFWPSLRHYQTHKLRDCSVKFLLPELKIG